MCRGAERIRVQHIVHLRLQRFTAGRMRVPRRLRDAPRRLLP